MHVTLHPELSVPLFEGIGSPTDIRAAALAMFASSEYLSAFGADTTVDQPARVTARAVMAEAVPPTEIQTSAAARHLRSLLDEYDHQVIDSTVQIRQFVTNRLIEEAAPGNKGAIRALELLGKIAGVDLFLERAEITVRHKTTEDLEATVREKLARLSMADQTEDVQFRMAGTVLEAEPVPVVVTDPFERAMANFDAATRQT